VLVTALSLLVVAVERIEPRAFPLLVTVGRLWRPGTYLVVFANDAELRPGGGFIGSFATVTISRFGWPRVRLEPNIYRLDDAFTATHAIPPPTALAGITDRWALRDSNWPIDGIEAARSVARFYALETGQVANGVVTLTAGAVQQLLAVTGPLPLGDGTSLTSEQFYDELHYRIEKAYFVDPANRVTNQPKQILAELEPRLVARLTHPLIALGATSWLADSLATKAVVVTFPDDRQRLLDERGWSNQVDQSAQGSLRLVNANAGGLKSSRSVTERTTLAVTTAASVATYQLTVERQHHGTGEWPDHRNDNWLELVVPAGAQLTAVSVNGRAPEQLPTESVGTRSMFPIRFDTDPGTTSVLTATVTVPRDPTAQPTFVWEAQPGALPEALTVTWNGARLIEGTIDRDRSAPLP
jgi:hypothetical protein